MFNVLCVLASAETIIVGDISIRSTEDFCLLLHHHIYPWTISILFLTSITKKCNSKSFIKYAGYLWLFTRSCTAPLWVADKGYLLDGGCSNGIIQKSGSLAMAVAVFGESYTPCTLSRPYIDFGKVCLLNYKL